LIFCFPIGPCGNIAGLVRVDGGIDQIAARPLWPRQGAIFVRPREPALANDIGDQNRRDFPGSHHTGPSGVKKASTKTRPGRGLFIEGD
jgi:hypothetical protein